MDARAHINTHAREFIDDLKQWLAIPSISADPEHHDDVRRSAEWLAAHLSTIGFPVAEVWETGEDGKAGLPAVFHRSVQSQLALHCVMQWAIRCQDCGRIQSDRPAA